MRLLSVATLCPLCFALAAGCGGRRSRPQHETASETSGSEQVNDGGRCDRSAPEAEVSEYDTSGDDRSDVRKVFRRVGDATASRLVLVCREADLDGDGTKDVVRFYSDDGRPLREESDRDFDGRVDSMAFFDRGVVSRLELDTNDDGRVDAKIYYDGGAPVRAQLDVAARSTDTEWRPDRWEYYDAGSVTRIGTDFDGDGRVDRWDRSADSGAGALFQREGVNVPAAEGAEATPTPPAAGQ